MKIQRATAREALVVEEREVRDAAAEHDDVGIEDVDHDRERSAEDVDALGEERGGDRVALLRELGDLGEPHGVRRSRAAYSRSMAGPER